MEKRVRRAARREQSRAEAHRQQAKKKDLPLDPVSRFVYANLFLIMAVAAIIFSNL
jgi:hypothetical protein